MRKFVLAVAAMAASASLAQAGMIYSEARVAGVGPNGMDEIQFKVAGFDGTDLVTNNKVTTLAGSLTSTGVMSVYSAPESEPDAGDAVTPADSFGNTNILGGISTTATRVVGRSFTNFPSFAAGPTLTPSESLTPSKVDFVAFTTAGGVAVNGNILRVYTTHDATVTFTGSINTSLAGVDVPVTMISAVPEPASLGVLAVGALGLLARRRKA